MIEVVGEVADGFFVHPLHSRAFVDADDAAGARTAASRVSGRARKDFTISCQTIVTIGSNDAEIEAARQKARGQIAFYGSTPAYRACSSTTAGGAPARAEPALEAGPVARDDGPHRRRAVRRDRRLRHAGAGRPRSCARATRFADRTTLMLYNETEPEAVVDVVRELAP